jgi:hypothetical protein
MSAFVESTPQHARHSVVLARDGALVHPAGAIGAALSVATPLTASLTDVEETGRVSPDVAGQSRCFELVPAEYRSCDPIWPAIRDSQAFFLCKQNLRLLPEDPHNWRTGDND